MWAYWLIAILIGGCLQVRTFKATAEAQATRPQNWQRRLSERFELESIAPDQDAFVLAIAGRILKEDEDTAGWTSRSRVTLQVFATLDEFRDTTGQPGWVAASTRGNTIRLQPLAQLRARSILESTLRHELFHVLVESKAAAGTPLWFREGLVLYFTGEIAGSATAEPIAAANIEDPPAAPQPRRDGTRLRRRLREGRSTHPAKWNVHRDRLASAGFARGRQERRVASSLPSSTSPASSSAR